MREEMTFAQHIARSTEITLCAFMLLIPTACTKVNFDNPLDPEGTNYIGVDNPSHGDSIAPSIVLNGPDTIHLSLNSSYVDSGATASDNVDGNITTRIISEGTVDAHSEGEYAITYTVFDEAGNRSTASRTIIVSRMDDVTPPDLQLNGKSSVTVYYGDPYVEFGATAKDNVDGNLNSNIAIAGAVQTDSLGQYQVVYSVKDAAGNLATKIRLVTVTDFALGDTLAPVIEVLGDNPLTLDLGSTFTDPGVTATDDTDGDLTSSILTDGTVDITTAGSYQLTYTCSDASGNSAVATRTVFVRQQNAADTDPPVLTLLGDNPSTLKVGDTFSDPGATAIDAQDGDITQSIAITSTVDAAKAGTYEVTYTISDAAGNTSSAKRIVKVENVVTNKDTVAPVMTLKGDNPMTIKAGESFADPGATALDDVDGNLTSDITVGGSVDTSNVGEYTLTYTVSDFVGNENSITRMVKVVDPATTGDMLAKYGAPANSALASVNTDFATIEVDGNGPAITNVTKLTVNWDLQNKGLYVFALNTSDGNPNWYVDLKSNVSHSFGGSKPQFSLSGSGFNGLDGEYYVAMDGSNFVWVATDGSFAIVFKP
ncbi:MAG: DUF5011 domain-containing protein [Chitinivibrionales bacterium]|nr:DUF5011 domain-containing protein [Chitinivibrionales bacterium]